jgi:hypothetical protein
MYDDIQATAAELRATAQDVFDQGWELLAVI